MSEVGAVLYENGNGRQLGYYIMPAILEAMRIWVNQMTVSECEGDMSMKR